MTFLPSDTAHDKMSRHTQNLTRCLSELASDLLTLARRRVHGMGGERRRGGWKAGTEEEDLMRFVSEAARLGRRVQCIDHFLDAWPPLLLLLRDATLRCSGVRMNVTPPHVPYSMSSWMCLLSSVLYRAFVFFFVVLLRLSFFLPWLCYVCSALFIEAIPFPFIYF